MADQAQTKLFNERRYYFILLAGIFFGALLFLVKIAPTEYALGAVIAFALLLAAGRRKIWLFAAAAIPALALGQIIFFEIRPNWIYDMTLAEALLLAAAGVYFFETAFLKRRFGADAVTCGLALYLALGILSFWQVIDRELYVAGLKVITFSFLAYQLGKTYLSGERNRARLLNALAITAVVMSGQIFYTFYKLGFSSKIFFERSTITTPIGAIALVSAILVMILPLLLAYYYRLTNEEKIRPFILFSFLLGWFAVFLTLGKGAILSLLIGLGYLLIKLKGKRVGIALSISLFAVAGFLILTPFFTGLFTRLATAFVDINSQFRIEEYRVAGRIIADNWLFGVGSGQQLVYYQEMISPYYRELVNNFFVQAMIDYGLFGLAVLIFVLAVIVKQAGALARVAERKNDLLLYGFIAGLLVAFFNGLVEVTFFALPYAIIFWLVVGVFINNNSNTSKNNSNLQIHSNASNGT